MTKNPKLFGTDGIRGTFGTYPLDGKTLTYVTSALAAFFVGQQKKETAFNPRVFVARDTRSSGMMIEHMLLQALAKAGLEAESLGVVPTPFLVQKLCAEKNLGGVMISASHNPASDNGFKIFRGCGVKIGQHEEALIESFVKERLGEACGIKKSLGNQGSAPQCFFPENLQAVLETYQAFLEGILGTFSLKGKRLVVDCAHGAFSYLAPALLEAYGADVVTMAARPDGLNINEKCGAAHPKAFQALTPKVGADFGIAFDGDGDRVVLCDASGGLIDGDQILALLALAWKEKGLLPKKGVVSTVMANSALEVFLNKQKIGLYRSDVGDKALLEMMSQKKAPLGAEPSGHVIIAPFLPTGDGLLTALCVLKALHELPHIHLPCFTPYPQQIESIRTDELKEGVRQNLDAFRHRLTHLFPHCLINLRFSGTEPLLRLMVEAPSKEEIQKVLEKARVLLTNPASLIEGLQ